MLRIIASLFLLACISPLASSADRTCITDWSIAAPIVHKEKLTTVEALSRIASDRLSGSVIVRTALCEERGEFAYRIIMRDAQGRLSTHIVDARTPFAR
ncbi:exported protein of unknown function [Hyphomicrobium sp. 1Nfss2.1]